jgi:hypothetical protein
MRVTAMLLVVELPSGQDFRHVPPPSAQITSLLKAPLLYVRNSHTHTE